MVPYLDDHESGAARQPEQDLGPRSRCTLTDGFRGEFGGYLDRVTGHAVQRPHGQGLGDEPPGFS
jgi:hypothetical protein